MQKDVLWDIDLEGIMVRELKISNNNLIIRKLDKDAVFCARYNGEVIIKWDIKSKLIKDSEG